MSDVLDELLNGDPNLWVSELPLFQREPISQLQQKGKSFDEIAESYISATAANTFRFSAVTSQVPNVTFLDNLRKEIRSYICGDKRYKAERDGLFGKKGLARSFIVSSIAVAVVPYMGVAAPVLAPLVALIIASFGKVTVSAWCATEPPAPFQPQKP